MSYPVQKIILELPQSVKNIDSIFPPRYLSPVDMTRNEKVHTYE